MPCVSLAFAAKEMDAGATKTAPADGLVSATEGGVRRGEHVVTDFAAFSRPPVATIPVSEGRASTLFKIDALNCAVFKAHVESTNIAAPATCGVAIDVPLMPPYAWQRMVEPMLLPGAARSTEVTP